MMVVDKNTNQQHNLTIYNPDFTDSAERDYLNLMYNLLIKGDKVIGRNGLVYQDFGSTLRFNLEREFPLLTSKKMFIRGIFEELIFFLKGQTDSNILTSKGVKIWQPNTTREFLDQRGLDYPVGLMGPMYGYNWRFFGKSYSNPEDKGFDQLDYVMKLLKTDPTSRRIIMTTFDPSTSDQCVLYPCHGLLVQFHTRPTGNPNQYYLDCIQTQRSCDMFLGIPFNIASYGLLVYLMCHILNQTDGPKYIPSRLILQLGNYHVYQQHLTQVQEQYLRPFNRFPQLNINSKATRMEDFLFEDLELIGYNPQTAIKAPMIE